MLRWKETVLGRCKTLEKLARNRKICLLFSGGLDSEFIARAFLVSKIPFWASIGLNSDQSNTEAVSSAIQFCKDKKIPFKVHLRDLTKVSVRPWTRELLMNVIMDHIETISDRENYIVCGEGDLKPIFKKKGIYYKAYRDGHPLSRHQKRTSIDYCPLFFGDSVSNPDLFISAEFMNLILMGAAQNTFYKYALYAQIFPEMKFQRKNSGFENSILLKTHRKLLMQSDPIIERKVLA